MAFKPVDISNLWHLFASSQMQELLKLFLADFFSSLETSLFC